MTEGACRRTSLRATEAKARTPAWLSMTEAKACGNNGGWPCHRCDPRAVLGARQLARPAGAQCRVTRPHHLPPCNALAREGRQQARARPLSLSLSPPPGERIEERGDGAALSAAQAESKGEGADAAWLHPHPRVTAVAQESATAAPLALSRKRASDRRPLSGGMEIAARASLVTISSAGRRP
jgi:hypothetical protein